MLPEVNVDNLKQSFRAETSETLAALEADLLELDENREDADLIGRIFRGLHSIKGSGAMLGFDGLAGFTHNLETAFNEVRNKRLAVTREVIDLSLSGLDQIRAMANEDGEFSADPIACAGILTRVRLLERTGGDRAAKPLKGKKKTDSLPGPAPARVLERGGPICEWSIRFAPGPEMLRGGANPLALLEELRKLGALAARADLSAVPGLAEMEADRCYASWELVLATAADANALRDVFIFVEDNCELSIEQIGGERQEADGLEDADEPHAAVEEAHPAFGGRRTKDRQESAPSLRVPAAKLDQFADLVGELVTVQARLAEFASHHEFVELDEISEQVERLSSALRDNSMKIRMLPIRATFERFRRLVHDLARDLGKDVDLAIEGADTELDKTVIDQLGDPLMHLVRNSMDHGIEKAGVRAALGKPRAATIRLSARHAGASVLIEVADDGGGIDREAVRQRAVEKGLISEDAELSEAETFALIFKPGFSTAQKLTDLSGRGVGMDVVREKVESLRGSIGVSSNPGVGTTITLRLPLTMAIIDGLLVSVAGASFVVPLANTLECIELSSEDIVRSNGKRIVNVRGAVVPYIRLREHFNVRAPRPELEQVMLVETAEGTFGFAVDKVLGDCQTVIKNLGRMYRNVQAVSGATILGNGTVALILDPDRLVQEALKGERKLADNRPAAGRAGKKK